MTEPVKPESLNPRSQPDSKPKSGGLKWLLIIGGIIVLAALIWYARHRAAAASDASSGGGGRSGGNFPVPVVTGKVMQKDVPIYLDGLGTVQAFNTVTVHTRVDGELVKVAFTEGQDVKTGDVLAQIDPAPYKAALDQAVAKKAQDEAQQANAKVDLKRYADLLASDGTTQQTYDTQKALVDQLGASVKADQAAIDSAQVNLDYATIHSPIDGRTGIRLVDQGNIVHASDAGGLVVLAQLKPISVIFTLPETVMTKLHMRQNQPSFTVIALTRDNTNVLATGELAVIDNQIDSTTGTIKIKANFANENLRLWPGEFVNTRLLLSTRTNGLVVPASVVQRGPEGSYAFVVQDDQTVKMRPLKVAQIDNGLALIDDGLKPDEVVVVDGQYKLQDGSHIKAAEPTGSGSTNAPAKAHQHKQSPSGQPPT